MDAFRDFLADSNSVVLLAEENEPVGYLYAQFQNHHGNWARKESHVLYIHHMVIDPKFRRKGNGDQLLSAAIDIARSRGVERLELDVWSFNVAAKKFYAKHGLKVFNEKMSIII
jgi:ribosomal protein S18 acetylase RimI-like enzyme